MALQATLVRRNRPGRAGVLMIALAALLTNTGIATAQPRLPGGNQQSYSASEREQFTEYAQWLADQLSEGQPVDVERARQRASNVLAPRSASVRFRVEFASQALGTNGTLIGLVGHEDDFRAINTLLVVGMIADRRSAAPIRVGLDDDRAAVRIAAAAAARTMLARLPGGDRAAQQSVSELTRALTDTISGETNPAVARACIGAMLSVGTSEMLLDAGLRDAAAAITDRSTDLREEHEGFLIEDGIISETPAGGWLAPHAQLLDAARGRMLNAGAGADLPREMLVGIARSGAMTLTLIRDTLAELEDADRQARLDGEEDIQRAERFANVMLPLASLAEGVMVEAQNRALGAGFAGDRTFAPALEDYAEGRGSIDEVREGLDEWVGQRGSLLDPPFSFDTDDFAEPDLN